MLVLGQRPSRIAPSSLERTLARRRCEQITRTRSGQQQPAQRLAAEQRLHLVGQRGVLRLGQGLGRQLAAGLADADLPQVQDLVFACEAVIDGSEVMVTARGGCDRWAAYEQVTTGTDLLRLPVRA